MLLNNPIILYGGVALAVFGAVQTLRVSVLNSRLDACRAQAVKLQELAREEANRHRIQIAEAIARAEAARARVPFAREQITKERTAHYAQNPAAASAVCLPAERVHAVNEGLRSMAAAAGVDAVPDQAAPGEAADAPRSRSPDR